MPLPFKMEQPKAKAQRPSNTDAADVPNSQDQMTPTNLDAASASENDIADEPNQCFTILSHHSYHDYANMNEPPILGTGVVGCATKTRGNSMNPFPLMLHKLLEGAKKGNYSEIVSWKPHGRAFHVHMKDRFVKDVMPLYFRQTRFASFQRQLNLYGFRRLTGRGPDEGAYYHELFLRGMPELSSNMVRMKVNGNEVRLGSSPRTEPNFYAMSVVREPSTREKQSTPKKRPAITQRTAERPSNPLDRKMLADSWKVPGDMQDAAIGSSSKISIEKPSSVDREYLRSHLSQQRHTAFQDFFGHVVPGQKTTVAPLKDIVVNQPPSGNASDVVSQRTYPDEDFPVPEPVPLRRHDVGTEDDDHTSMVNFLSDIDLQPSSDENTLDPLRIHHSSDDSSVLKHLQFSSDESMNPIPKIPSAQQSRSSSSKEDSK
jgi:hypothetical protein